MTGHGTKFGRKKEEAIAGLLSQRNIEEAARSAGIGTTTLLRWLQLPEFQTGYREARRDAYSQSIARLQQASGAVVSTLLKVMVEVDSPAASRVRAADCVLGHAAKAIKLEDIEDQLIHAYYCCSPHGTVIYYLGNAAKTLAANRGLFRRRSCCTIAVL